MENATKALIIAATILISVLIATIAVYLFATYSQFAYENEQRQIQQEQAKYNAKFEKYCDKILTIHDVITIAGMAHEYNIKHDKDHYGEIKVYLGNKKIDEISDKDKSDKLENNEDKTYEIKIEKENNIIKKIQVSESR